MTATKKSVQPWVAGGFILVSIAVTALFLARFTDFQKLGRPGVEVVFQNVHDETGRLVATNAVGLPMELPGYLSTNLPISRVELDWLPRDTTYGRMFYQASNGMQFLMSAVLMGRDRTSIHKPEYCLVGQGLRIDAKEISTIEIKGAKTYPMPVMKMTCSREVKLDDGSVARQRALYVYWFVADGQLSAEHNKRMLSMAWDLVTTGVLQRWAYISCFAYAEPGQEDAVYTEMEELIAQSVPHFQTTSGPPIRLASED